GVLGAGDADLAFQARAAADDDLLQGTRRALGGRPFGLGALACVFLAEAPQGAGLAAPLLAADLVAVMGAHRAAPPPDVVLAAVALGADRPLALLGAAGLAGGLGTGDRRRRRCRFRGRLRRCRRLGFGSFPVRLGLRGHR